MKTQLLCTFIELNELDETLQNIISNHSIVFNKIYIFTLDDNPEELICTYNVDSINTSGILPKTISLHRKKQSNTMYTINALNALIRSLNNGYLDKKFPINWNDYQNTLLLTNKENGFSKINTKLQKIIDTNKF